MAEIIKTDGTRQPVQPANGTDFKLEEMQAIVGGDIEIMVVNEEGKVHGLKHNPTATRIFKENHPSLSDYIVGDVLVCKEEQIK